MAEVAQWEATFRENMQRLRALGSDVQDHDVEAYCAYHEFLLERIPAIRAGQSFFTMSQSEKSAFCRVTNEYLTSHPEFGSTLARVSTALVSGRKRSARMSLN